ncbi:MAG: TIR domain-containing protein [Bacteroidales bacterium]|nr:TIR domain-containing protein [Bacteroidales bacterium]
MSSNPIEINATKILIVLFENNPEENLHFKGADIQELTGLKPLEINNAIDYLDNHGLLKRINYKGTKPYNFGEVYLNVEGKFQYHELMKENNSQENEENKTKMKIFISHSHKDIEIAKVLIELLRVSLNLKVDDIRCTSVDGHRLPAGISTDEQLKLEIHDSEVLIGLISPSSISSYYVLFELGARWGVNKPLIPLLTNKKGADLLKGPLQGINALNTNSEAQLFQLITDLGKLLDISPEAPNSYQSYITKLSKLSMADKVSTNSNNQNNIIKNVSEYSDSDEKIKKHCKDYWPDDYSMQVSCINEQKEAVKILKKSKPDDISEDDFILIRKKAAEDWSDDFTMRVSQEKEQFEAIRKLKDL